MKRFISILLVLLATVSIASCAKEKAPEGEGEGDAKVFASRYADLTEANNEAVLQSDNFTVSVSMFNYYYTCVLRNYVQNCGDSVPFDKSQPLREQIYDSNQGASWFDYMAYQTSETVKIKLYLAEAALEEGIVLEDKDYEPIDKEINNIDATAQGEGVSTAMKIKTYYGETVDEAAIRKALELNALGGKYNTEVLDDKYNFSDESYDNYFEENKNYVLAFNYVSYQIPKDAENTEAILQEFKSAADDSEFVEITKKYIFSHYPKVTEDNIDSALDALRVNGQYYSDESEFAIWAYDKDRKVYDVYSEVSDAGVTRIAMLLPGDGEAYTDVLYKDITPLHNISAVFLSEEQFAETGGAMVMAEKVYELAMGNTEFSTVCTMYGGGNTSNIIRGSTPPAVEKWVFDEERTEGEIGIVEDEGFGVYVIKMRADGMEAWKYRCATTMANNTYSDDLDAFKKKYTVKENAEAAYKISEISI